jgi:tetratricopeptide (TPR) repeat protein
MGRGVLSIQFWIIAACALPASAGTLAVDADKKVVGTLDQLTLTVHVPQACLGGQLYVPPSDFYKVVAVRQAKGIRQGTVTLLLRIMASQDFTLPPVRMRCRTGYSSSFPRSIHVDSVAAKPPAAGGPAPGAAAPPPAGAPMSPAASWMSFTDKFRGVDYSPDGRLLAAASPTGVRLWDTASGRVISQWNSPSVMARFSPDGRRLLSAGGADKLVKLWDVASGSQIGAWAGHTDGVVCVAISPAGDRAVSGGLDHAILLWDLGTGKNIATWTGHKAAVMNLAFTPDGRRVLSASLDKTVKVWDAASGKNTATWQTQAFVSAIAVSPDGAQALTGSAGAPRGTLPSVTLWDIAGGRPLATWQGFSGDLFSVAFSPDGKTALTGSGDKTVKLWSAASGRNIAVGTQAHPALGLAFSPDGRSAASCGGDGTIAIWSISRALAADPLWQQELGKEARDLAAREQASRSAQEQAALAAELATVPGDFSHAMQLLNAGKPAEAQPLLERCARLAPDEAQYRNWLGYAYLQLSDGAKASEQFADLSRRKGSRSEVWNFYWGVSQFGLGAFDAARESFSAAIADGPKTGQANLDVAQSKITAISGYLDNRSRALGLVEQGQWDAARQAFEAARGFIDTPELKNDVSRMESQIQGARRAAEAEARAQAQRKLLMGLGAGLAAGAALGAWAFIAWRGRRLAQRGLLRDKIAGELSAEPAQAYGDLASFLALGGSLDGLLALLGLRVGGRLEDFSAQELFALYNRSDHADDLPRQLRRLPAALAGGVREMAVADVRRLVATNPAAAYRGLRSYWDMAGNLTALSPEEIHDIFVASGHGEELFPWPPGCSAAQVLGIARRFSSSGKHAEAFSYLLEDRLFLSLHAIEGGCERAVQLAENFGKLDYLLGERLAGKPDQTTAGFAAALLKLNKPELCLKVLESKPLKTTADNKVAAKALLALGRVEESLAAWEKILKSEWTGEECVANCKLLLDLGRVEAALRLLPLLEMHWPLKKDPEFYYSFALRCEKEKQTQAAVGIYRKFVDTDIAYRDCATRYSCLKEGRTPPPAPGEAAAT